MELDVDKVSLATYFQITSYMSMISPSSTFVFSWFDCEVEVIFSSLYSSI